MAVKYLGNGSYTALAADVKPTTAPVNATLLETDTKRLYVYSGGVWNYEFLAVYADDLQDVVVTAPFYNQTLRYDGLSWVNSNPPLSENPLLKSGEWYPLQSTDYAIGLLTDGLSVTGTNTKSNHTVGRATKLETAGATNPVGITQTFARYRRQFDSQLYCYFVGVSGVSNTRYFFGFQSSATAPTSDAPFDAGVEGIFVSLRNADNGSPAGTIKVLHNDATGTTIVDDTGIAYGSSSNRHKVELVLSSNNAKVYIDDQLTNTITTELPAAATDMYPFWTVHKAGGSEKYFEIYKIGVITK